MSTDFKLTPGAAYLHVLLAPQYEIRPEGVTEPGRGSAAC